MYIISHTIEAYTHLTQGILLVAFGLLLRHYFKAYQRHYLRYWAYAAMVFGLSEITRFTGMQLNDLLAATDFASDSARGTTSEFWVTNALYAISLAAQYLSLVFLGMGVLNITRGELPFAAARRLLYYGAILAGVISVAAFAITPELIGLEATFGPVSKFLITGLVLLVISGVILRTNPSALGPTLIAASFGLIGIKNLVVSFLFIAPFASGATDLVMAIKGIINLVLLMMGAIGVVIWLLESERNNTVMAIQRAEYLDTHDALTGVENREQLVSKIPVFIDYCRSNGRHLTVLLVGINRFKAINDMLGIRGGDRVLTELANRLEEFEPQPLAVARISGDVFAVMFDHLKRRSFILDLANQLLERLHKPMKIDGRTINISCALGISRFPQHGTRAELLLNKATIALANAKLIDNDSVIFYERGMDEPYTRLVDLEPDLKRALAQDEFLLYLQPFEDAQSGNLCGFEALIRWQHPTRGLIGPGEFLPFIEQLGMASELDDWVLEHAAQMMARWREQYHTLVPLAVNLSAKHFQQPELANKLKRLLSKHQLPANLISLEITENVAMSDIKTGMNVITELQNMGLSVAIDDFGTGYSSLAYLRQLPINRIKIDRSFIAELEESDADATIVRALIRLSHGLGKQVVAEGVEKAHQYALLKALNCDVIQGYYYSPPVAETHATDMLARIQTAADKASPVRLKKAVAQR